MKERVVILGAGIAGMTAGINLLQKGYDVTIVEQSGDVGGLCFGYFVNGHYIDACIHWLMGTNKKSQLYKEWSNIGALGKDVKIIPLPTLGTFEYEGTKVTFYRDLDKTEKELLAISPEDKRAIHKFIASAKDMGTLMGLALKNKNLNTEELLRTLPNSTHILRSMTESREKYSKRFKHPAIRFAMKNAQTGYNNMFFFLDLYGLFSTGNADVPEGGAYYMVQRIKERFLDLGGNLMLNTAVTKLIVEEGKVTIAEIPSGFVPGNHFISTIDPLYTMRELLNNEYRIWLFDHLEKTVHRRSISSCFNVYVTLEGDITHLDVPTVFNTKPMKVGAKDVEAMLVRPYHFDPKHFYKDGKTTVSLFIDQNEDDYAYYKSLTPAEYLEEKEKTTERMINAFLEHFPEYQGKLEFLSSFGPLELNEKTHSSFGSIQSYSFTNKGMFYLHNGRINEIENLYLCGQWSRAIGGTPTALLTAVEVCKFFGKKGSRLKIPFLDKFKK